MSIYIYPYVGQSLVGPPGPLWAGPSGDPWAPVCRALAGPPCALVGRSLVGPLGSWWAGPPCASLAPWAGPLPALSRPSLAGPLEVSLELKVCRSSLLNGVYLY